jgi:hypothetical protein
MIDRYVAALRAADKGGYEPLLAFLNLPHRS